MWKNRSPILAAHEKKLDSSKKLRRTEREKVEEQCHLLKWSIFQRDLPVSGSCFKFKWIILPKDLEKTVLWALTNDWISYKKGNNISCGRLLGKQQAFVHRMWKSGKLKCERMQSRIMKIRIFLMLTKPKFFYKITPDETLKFEEGNCTNEKLSKVRMSVFVCTNMNGSGERKLLL